jgi:glutathione S-transferase
MRARLALAISATPVELREVKLSTKPEAMLAASPKATVPVLVLPDGKVIDQSIDIMHWALARNDPEGWLERDDPALIIANDGPFKYALDRYKYPERHGSNAETHRMNGLAFLQQIEDRLSKAANLGGATPSLADAAIIPFVRQFAAVDPDWFAEQQLARLKIWLSGYLRSDLFGAIMFRAPTWSPLDAPIIVDWGRGMRHVLPAGR